MHTQMDAYQATKLAAQPETKITDLPDEILCKITKHVGSTTEEILPFLMSNRSSLSSFMSHYDNLSWLLTNERWAGFQHAVSIDTARRTADDEYARRHANWVSEKASHMLVYASQLCPGWDQVPVYYPTQEQTQAILQVSLL